MSTKKTLVKQPKGQLKWEFKKWESKIKGLVRSSPVIMDGVVYVGSDDGNLYAIE